MIAKPTRALINALSFVGICWIAYVIFASITGRWPWRPVARFFGSEYREASPAGVFAACVLPALLLLIATGWLIWRVAIRGRYSDEDFPTATRRR